MEDGNGYLEIRARIEAQLAAEEEDLRALKAQVAEKRASIKVLRAALKPLTSGSAAGPAREGVNRQETFDAMLAVLRAAPDLRGQALKDRVVDELKRATGKPATGLGLHMEPVLRQVLEHLRGSGAVEESENPERS